MSKVVSLLAISVALTLSGSHVFAKSGAPSQVKTSGKSAADPERVHVLLGSKADISRTGGDVRFNPATDFPLAYEFAP